MERLTELVSAQDWLAAWAEYRRLEEAGPSSARLQLLGSHAAYGLRDLATAKGLAELALADAPQDRLLGQVRFHIGMVLRELGEVEGALAQFDAFLTETVTVYPELAVHTGKLQFYRALCHRQVGDLLQSAASYRLALTSLTGWERSATLQNLAWVYCLMGCADEARAALNQVDTQGDSILGIHQGIGEAYLDAIEGELGRAFAGCEVLSARGDLGAQEMAEVSWVAALSAQRSGDLEKAVVLCKSALAYALDAQDARLTADAEGLAQDIETLRRAG